MLRHEIVTQVQDLVEDPTYWTAARITAMANKCQDEIANKLAIVVEGYLTFTSVADQQTYLVPADFIANRVLYFNGTNRQIIRIKKGPENIYGVVSDPTDSGTPTTGFMWTRGGLIELWLYPVFATSCLTLQCFYYRRPPQLVNDNDRSMLPVDWHTYIVDYVERRTWLQDERRDWSPLLFDAWWRNTLIEIEMSQLTQELMTETKALGSFDDQMPPVNASLIFVRESSDGGLIW